MTNLGTRGGIYAVANLLVALAAFVGSGIHHGVAHPVYVVLLFGLCSLPVLQASAVNGRYALLALWSAFYFVMYGALDLRNLVLGSEFGNFASDGVFDPAECVILAGAAAFQVGYQAVCRLAARRGRLSAPKNWSETMLVLFGIALWCVSSWLTWKYDVDLIVVNSTAAYVASMDAIGGIGVMLFMIARMAQPVAILILAYAQCRYKRPYLAPIVIGVVLYQFVFGFVIDTKSEAIIGAALVLLTNLLVNGRIPKTWLALMLFIVLSAFPLLQANRVVRGEHDQGAAKVSQNLLESFHRALEAMGRVNTGRERAQTALERATTKGSVEMIVDGIAAGHAYQRGATLTPMLVAFIPRILWEDKPGISTGQVLNREFHVSESADTYISPSHLGELYWNFGWSGAVGGMLLIGALLGYLGAKFDLEEAATITRLLIIVVTVRQLILQSEGEFANQYVVWMRSVVAIGFLHWLFARIPWQSRVTAASTPEPAGPPPLPFPNLLR